MPRKPTKYLDICRCPVKHLIKNQAKCPDHIERKRIQKEKNRNNHLRKNREAQAIKYNAKVKLRNLVQEFLEKARIYMRHGQPDPLYANLMMVTYTNWLYRMYSYEESANVRFAENILEAAQSMGIDVSIVDTLPPNQEKICFTRKMVYYDIQRSTKITCRRRSYYWVFIDFQNVQDYFDYDSRQREEHHLELAERRRSSQVQKPSEYEIVKAQEKAIKQLKYLNSYQVEDDSDWMSPNCSQETILAFKDLQEQQKKLDLQRKEEQETKPSVDQEEVKTPAQPDQVTLAAQYFGLSPSLIKQVQDKAAAFEQRQQEIKEALSKDEAEVRYTIYATILEQLYLKMAMVDSAIEFNSFCAQTFSSNRWSGKYLSKEDISNYTLRLVDYLGCHFKVAMRSGQRYIIKQKKSLPPIHQIKADLKKILSVI